MERHGPTMNALAPVRGDLGGWSEIPSESPMPVPLGTALSARASSRGFSSSCPRAASTLNPTRGFFDTNMRGTYEASFSRRRPFETDGTNAQNSTPPCVGVVRRQRQPTGDALAASVGNDSSSESTSVCSDVGCARTRWAADTVGVTNGARAARTWAPVVRWRRRAPWLDNLQACACTGVSEAPAPATVQAVREEPQVSRSERWIGRGRGRLPTSLAKETGWQLRGTFLYAWESVSQRRLELPQSTCQGLNLGRSGVSS